MTAVIFLCSWCRTHREVWWVSECLALRGNPLFDPLCSSSAAGLAVLQTQGTLPHSRQQTLVPFFRLLPWKPLGGSWLLVVGYPYPTFRCLTSTPTADIHSFLCWSFRSRNRAVTSSLFFFFLNTFCIRKRSPASCHHPWLEQRDGQKAD